LNHPSTYYLILGRNPLWDLLFLSNPVISNSFTQHLYLLHFYLATMPFITSPPHLLNRRYRHPGAPPQRRSPRLILHSLSPHQRSNDFRRLLTPPTHPHNRGDRDGVCPSQRQSLRLSLQSLPPHRRDEFQRRREWFQFTTLESLQSIPAPQRRHWEDNYWHHCRIALLIGQENRRLGELNAQALPEHLNVHDDPSDGSINSDSHSNFDSDATVPFVGTSNANNVIDNANSSGDSTQDDDFSDHGDDNQNNIPHDGSGAGVSYY